MSYNYIIKFFISVKQSNKSDSGITQSSTIDLVEFPSPRSHSGLAYKHNILYVYGGILEKGSKSLTLQDFYSLGKQ